MGIGVQVFLGSLITSLQTSLVEQTIGNSPQVIVRAAEDGTPVDYAAGLRQAMESQPQITTVVPTRSFSAIFKQGAESAPLQVIGGQLAQLDTIYDISGRLTAGTAQLGAQQVMVGTDFAATYGLKPGDTASLRASRRQARRAHRERRLRLRLGGGQQRDGLRRRRLRRRRARPRHRPVHGRRRAGERCLRLRDRRPEPRAQTRL